MRAIILTLLTLAPISAHADNFEESSPRDGSGWEPTSPTKPPEPKRPSDAERQYNARMQKIDRLSADLENLLKRMSEKEEHGKPVVRIR